ncbi:MAG TPA: biotin--[acetyl-CoA-carboxylase] ligase [Gemmatimonadaceae bacterium]|nr:biotin--[acetyl-CoA-carboxylase] ligase [Gemmatimonadaceae bacterium]
MPRQSTAYDGLSVPALETRLGVPSLLLFDAVGSTLDVAHRVAPDAPSGTLVLANEQTAGRGRHGRRWDSRPGAGIWLSLIERPTDARALDVLSLRCGLYAAEALDAVAGMRVGLKWPNDLYLGERKLAGILIETRWRGTAPDWVAIGFGLNVSAPALATGVGLPAGTARPDVLEVLVPALRRAAAAPRHLSDDELARWRARDLAGQRALIAPVAGRAAGISREGELLVLDDGGAVSRHRSGSLTFAEAPACS